MEHDFYDRTWVFIFLPRYQRNYLDLALVHYHNGKFFGKINYYIDVDIYKTNDVTAKQTSQGLVRDDDVLCLQ